MGLLEPTSAGLYPTCPLSMSGRWEERSQLLNSYATSVGWRIVPLTRTRLVSGLDAERLDPVAKWKRKPAIF